MASFGIVIPAHNEEDRIQFCLQSLAPFQNAKDPIIVIDASSNDRTTNIAESCGVQVLRSQLKSRGLAIAMGVNELTKCNLDYTAILIAHADMIFPPDSRSVLVHALNTNSHCAGGAFGHRIDAPEWWFRIVERGNNFRAHWLQMPYGDQAQFFRPHHLPAMGGFPQQDWLEDVELDLRLKQQGKLVFLNRPVFIPSRHWDKGVVRSTICNWLTVLRYLLWRPKLISGIERTSKENC